MKIGFLGCGNMGSSIALSLIGQYETLVFDTDIEKAKAITGAKVFSDVDEMLSQADIILIAVKPQILPSLYDLLSNYKNKKFISIAAGVPLEVLERKIGSSNIVRFMPNLAARSKNAVTAVAAAKQCDQDFLSIALDVANHFGSAFILDEALFPAFIGISGSAIAYVFEFVHALAMGGTDQGISYTQSVKIATDTLLSAASLLKESGKNPVELMSMVCSAKGTTIKGMNELYSNGFDNAVIKAVIIASEKSKELEQIAKEK